MKFSIETLDSFSDYFSFRRSHSAAVSEVIDKWFFALDREMNNLELDRDGFFNFDPWLKFFFDMHILLSHNSGIQNFKIMSHDFISSTCAYFQILTVLSLFKKFWIIRLFFIFKNLDYSFSYLMQKIGCR